MIGIIGIATLAAVIAAPCDLVSAPNGPGSKATVSMSDARVVTVHVTDPRNPKYPDEIMNPGMKNYDVTIKLVGGISPGQTKDMPQVVGSITMNGDRSLEIRGSDVVDIRTVQVNDKDYARILSLVGPLEPGEWVALKAPPPGTCEPH
jgi:hypothetical protein